MRNVLTGNRLCCATFSFDCPDVEVTLIDPIISTNGGRVHSVGIRGLLNHNRVVLLKDILRHPRGSCSAGQSDAISVCWLWVVGFKDGFCLAG